MRSRFCCVKFNVSLTGSLYFGIGMHITFDQICKLFSYSKYNQILIPIVILFQRIYYYSECMLVKAIISNEKIERNGIYGEWIESRVNGLREE